VDAYVREVEAIALLDRRLVPALLRAFIETDIACMLVLGVYKVAESERRCPIFRTAGFDPGYMLRDYISTGVSAVCEP
jgi:hypothetical protein